MPFGCECRGGGGQNSLYSCPPSGPDTLYLYQVLEFINDLWLSPFEEIFIKLIFTALGTSYCKFVVCAEWRTIMVGGLNSWQYIHCYPMEIVFFFVHLCPYNIIYIQCDIDDIRPMMCNNEDITLVKWINCFMLQYIDVLCNQP